MIKFIKGTPAVLVEPENALVVGDMHLGKELAMRNSGIYFADAAKSIATELLKIYENSNASRLILLGDVKESIAYPPTEERRSILDFFHLLGDIRISIAKGNHDAHLAEVLHDLGIDAEVKHEINLRQASLMHGNSMPSEEALGKRHVIMAHGHAVVRGVDSDKKIWIVAGPGKGSKRYGVRKNSKLVIAPAFSRLIGGTRLSQSLKQFIPAFRNDLFDFKSSIVYDLEKKLLGKADDIASED